MNSMVLVDLKFLIQWLGTPHGKDNIYKIDTRRRIEELFVSHRRTFLTFKGSTTCKSSRIL